MMNATSKHLQVFNSFADSKSIQSTHSSSCMNSPLSMEDDWLVQATRDESEGTCVKACKIYVDLGDLYRSGEVVPQNFKKARCYYQQAVELKEKVGDSATLSMIASAHCWLGWMYEYGYGVQTDYLKAFDNYERSADLGEANACYKVGITLLKGRHGIQNFWKAAEYFQLAVDQNHAESCNMLRYMYLNGWGVARDDKVADQLRFKNCSPKHALPSFVIWDNNRERQRLEAEQFESKNIDWAFAIYNRMACEGDGLAQLKCAVLIQNGIYAGMNRDHTFSYAKKAALLRVVGAYDLMEVCYRLGIGVPKDEALAMEWCQDGAVLNHPEACYRLACMYQAGQGMPKDERSAFEFYSIAANQGHPRGCLSLSACYEQGIGVAKDSKLAAKWCNKSASICQQQIKDGSRDAWDILAAMFMARQFIPNAENVTAFKITLNLDNDAMKERIKSCLLAMLTVTTCTDSLKITGLTNFKDWNFIYSVLEKNKTIKLLDLRGSGLNKTFRYKFRDPEYPIVVVKTIKEFFRELCNSSRYSAFEVMDTLITDDESFNQEMAQLMQIKARRTHERRVYMYL